MKLNPATLAVIRFSLGLSQAELARRSGVGQGYISQIEKGDRDPSAATVKKLADAMGIPLAALITAPETATA